MRLYRNLVEASALALQEIFNEKKLADRVVQATLRSNPKWGSKDRRFIASTVYEVVRWYRLYYESLGFEPQKESDWWLLLATKWYIENEDLPDWPEFGKADRTAILTRYKAVANIRKIKESIPDWLDELGSQELGADWAATLKASNEQADLHIRVNTLKTTPNQLIAALERKGIEAKKTILENALLIPKRQKLTPIPSFRKGWFEIQDLSSQLVAAWLNPIAGSTVIDACAGAGGKSLHLSSLMHNQGEIIALDISTYKLKELEKRARRSEISIIKTQKIKGFNSLKKLNSTADYLLLDSPCSGLGTLRRNPNAKWHLSPDFITKVKKTQQAILQSYSPTCKIGGKMVYATCSILPSENIEQVQHFLDTEAGSGFRLIKDKSILPQDGWGDGFYMALMERIQ